MDDKTTSITLGQSVIETVRHDDVAVKDNFCRQCGIKYKKSDNYCAKCGSERSKWNGSN